MSMKMKAGLALVAVLVVGSGVLVALSGRSDGASRASARLIDTNGREAGSVRFSASGNTVTVNGEVRVPGSMAGFHGFHVHAKGVCDPKAVDETGKPAPFSSAGGHLSDAGQTHSNHVGDMPSLLVNRDGYARINFQTDRATLQRVRGAAVIVHGGRDNFANIPPRYAPKGPDAMTLATGDAGGRILCGVIR